MEFLNSLTDDAYSEGVKIDQFVFCAGARPVDLKTGTVINGDFRTKVRCTLDNVKRVLHQANASLENVFSTYVYVRNMADRPIVNEVFKEYFKERKYPNRVIVEVSRLLDNQDIEIVCSAYMPKAGEEVKYLTTQQGQIPTGPFSQGIKIGQYVFCSGVRPIDSTTQKLVVGDFRQRVRQCFDNLKAVLAEGEATMDDVFTTIVYVRNMADRPIVNEVTREYFREGNFPLRIIVEISRLNEDHDLEIECAAYLGAKDFLTTRKGQVPTGPFSQGVKIGHYVYCSGVRPIDPITQKLVEGDFEKRVCQCLDNLGAIMAEGGADFSDVYTTTVYLRNMSNLPTVHKVFAKYFDENSYPVRHNIEINRLNEDHDIEIACSAYLE
ncbi:MAG: hypothetical protein APF84_15585 [Gracilibacter sp. BRH_c7a]|nr:MAG: hypothetical protein APF84_15585 [Gracilibacter sp. BRH_c7a]